MSYFSLAARPKAPKPHQQSLYDQRLIQPAADNASAVQTMAPWADEAGKAATSFATALGHQGPLYGQLESDASNELALDGDLTADEVRQATQGSRAAFAARGLLNSAPSAFGEVLSRIQFSNQRKAERRANAASVETLGQQRQSVFGNVLESISGSNLGAQALAEEQRIADLTRDDTLKFNDKRIAADIKIGNSNAAAGAAAGKSATTGAAIGAVGVVAAAVF